MKHIVTICGLAVLLAACAAPTPISSNVLKDVTQAAGNPAAPLTGTIIKGLQDSSFNLDNAMTVLALPPSDPAAACVHGVLQQVGADVTNTLTDEVPVAVSGTSTSNQFTPKISDLLSAGSVAYIRFQQGKAAIGNGITVPVGCEALLGKIVIDGANKAAQTGTGILTGSIVNLPLVKTQ